MHISDLLIKLSTYKIDLFALDSFESHHFISHSLNLISYTGTLILMAIYLNCELLKLQVCLHDLLFDVATDNNFSQVFNFFTYYVGQCANGMFKCGHLRVNTFDCLDVNIFFREISLNIVLLIWLDLMHSFL